MAYISPVYPRISRLVWWFAAGGQRRHSLASTMTDTSVDQLAAMLGVEEEGASPGHTLTTLHTPHPSSLTPLSPGIHSLHSNWSELINLERKDSIGSYHSEGEAQADMDDR